MSEVVERVQGEVVWMDGSLEADERIIERGMTSFVEVGAALQHIRDRGLYVQAGYDTFEDYCRERWDISIRRSQEIRAAANVVGLLERRAIARLPQTEHAVRPLTKVLNDQGEEAVVNAWQQIVDGHEADGPITAREVNRFLTYGEGANYGKPGWNELLGQVGDTLLKAQKEMSKFESAVGGRKVKTPTREKAARYASWAEDLTERLREL